MNVLENVTYQTCKSFAYFNSLLVVANFSVKKKKNECITPKLCYTAIQDNCIKKQHSILIVRFSLKCYYIDSMITLLT